ncbi:Proteasome assembly chaperone [Hirschfeldia incana]|nr:Proteasome assembly chaperone [Hirschfeldia incana]KAJ0232086.1 Proteasome assembly chaperone [Hirschfeldia incana]KAJ0232087.1 Proteasome assembly chaperone [Hirschfeldia incana]
METEYDQVLHSVAHVQIADQNDDSGGVNPEEDGLKVSCFTEVHDDVTLHFQIIRLAKQIYVWIGYNSAKFGNLYAAALTRPSNTVSVTSVLGGTSDNTGSGIARRLVMKTGLNIIMACNIPKNNPLLEAKAEKMLIRKLIDLGYTMPTPLRAT